MWNEQKLNDLLSAPSRAFIQDIVKIDGDIMILGAGGKMGPTLAVLAKKAIREAGINKRVIAVSRFSDSAANTLLHDNDVEMIGADLMEDGIFDKLPDVQNIIYMAGKKFGTNGNECDTWSMNTSLPTLVTRRYKTSNIVVFSTGNIYPMVAVTSGGCLENHNPAPVGEYAMSCLGRERVFEYAARHYGTKVMLYRLNYAVDLRYGVLYDLASKIMEGQPISLRTSCFNCIWQGYANEVAIRSLLYTSNPAERLNVTGSEIISVKYAATKLGEHLGKKPIFEGEEGDMAYLNNSFKCIERFGYPSIGTNQLIRWQAEWILSGGRSLGKPTHFDERKGNF